MGGRRWKASNILADITLLAMELGMEADVTCQTQWKQKKQRPKLQEDEIQNMLASKLVILVEMFNVGVNNVSRRKPFKFGCN